MPQQGYEEELLEALEAEQVPQWLRQWQQWLQPEAVHAGPGPPAHKSGSEVHGLGGLQSIGRHLQAG